MVGFSLGKNSGGGGITDNLGGSISSRETETRGIDRKEREFKEEPEKESIFLGHQGGLVLKDVAEKEKGAQDELGDLKQEEGRGELMRMV